MKFLKPKELSNRLLILVLGYIIFRYVVGYSNSYTLVLVLCIFVVGIVVDWIIEFFKKK